MENLTDQQLISTLKSLVKNERRITAEIIALLKKVDTRHLYRSCGYSSLFEFCTKELGYSEAAAYRRISAVKLSQQIPQAEESLKEGSMSLSAACALQSFLRTEEKVKGRIYAPEQKEELFEKIQNKSRREIEKLLLSEVPTILPPEEKRSVTPYHYEIKMVVNKDMMDKVHELRKLLSSEIPNPSYAELFEFLLDQYLKDNRQQVSLRKSYQNETKTQ